LHKKILFIVLLAIVAFSRAWASLLDYIKLSKDIEFEIQSIRLISILD